MTLDCAVSLHRLLRAVKGHFWELLVSNIIGYLSFYRMDAACQRNANQKHSIINAEVNSPKRVGLSVLVLFIF